MLTSPKWQVIGDIPLILKVKDHWKKFGRLGQCITSTYKYVSYYHNRKKGMMDALDKLTSKT